MTPRRFGTGWDCCLVAIAVHFKSDHAESEAVDGEIAFYDKHAIPYRTLRDGEALIIDGETERVVGSAG